MVVLLFNNYLIINIVNIIITIIIIIVTILLLFDLLCYYLTITFYRYLL